MQKLIAFFKWFFAFALISAVLHGIWEHLHVPLYGGYEHLTTLPIEVYATLGDIAYSIVAIILISLFKRNTEWLKQPSKHDYLVLASIGFLIALFVEYKALALGRWFYLSSMPIIPILHVGLSPILQMTLLLPLSIYIISRMYKRVVG